jgi:hypothetical protein
LSSDSEDLPIDDEGLKRNISRRRLGKILAASGGALAVSSFITDKWVKPIIELVSLPAHAQASPSTLLSISNLRVSGVSVPPAQFLAQEAVKGEAPLMATFDYQDAAATIGGSTTLTRSLAPCNSNETNTLNSIAAKWGPSPSAGSINFKFSACPPSPLLPTNPHELCVNISSGGRISNTICSSFNVTNTSF